MKFLCVLILAALLKHAGAACSDIKEYPRCSGCGGDCYSENGCICGTNASQICVSNFCSMDSNECCPPGYYWNSSASCCTDVPICSPSCAADEVCVNRSMIATCECDSTKYIGQKIEVFKPTIICNTSSITTSVSRCLLTQLGYDYSTIHLTNDSVECTFNYDEILNDQRVETTMIRAEKGWCGTTATVGNSQVYYMNTLHIDPLPSKVITKNPIAYNFTCGYNLNMQTSLLYALKPVTSTAVLTPVTGNGEFSVIMAAYKNPAFTILWENGDIVTVGTDVYLGIFLSPNSGNNYTVRVESCLATASNDVKDLNQVTLMENGCAVKGDIEFQVLENGNSVESRFKMKAFQFQASPNNLFIFCQVTLCDKGEECKQCKTSRAGNENLEQLSLNLPVEDLFLGDSGSQKVFSWAMIAGSLLTLLFMKLY